jgi:flagellar basal-body rod modification protein FlgD
VASATATATAGTGGGASDPSIGDRFLTLLVTQLQNQDPLNPMDNAQLTSQLAQISTVTGVNKLNDSMSALAASLGANQYLQSAGLVGHSVLVPGEKLQLSEHAAPGGFTLPQDVDSVVVTVSDASGRVVRQIDLGAQTAGTQTFDWDGNTDSGAVAADGVYTFSLRASSGGTAVTAESLMSGHVDGVVLDASGKTILQLGRLGRVELSLVREIG